MRTICGIAVLGANSKKQVFSVPFSSFLNCSIKVDATTYIGGSEIETSKGLPMEAGEVLGFSSEDFKGEKGDFSVSAASIAGSNVYYLIWLR